MTTPTLPAVPELPEHRQEQIRADLLRSLDTNRRRPAAIAATATAAAGVLAVGVGVTSWQFAGGSAPGEGQLEVGVGDDEREAIVQGCIRNVDGPGANNIDLDEPGDYEIRNLISDQRGKLGLLYSDDNSLLPCSIDEPGYPRYNSGSTRVAPATGPLTVDVRSAVDGFGDDGTGTEFVGGRIGGDVVRVTVTSDGETAQATLANGTFLVRMVHAGCWEAPDRDAVQVRAYDKLGNLLATQNTVDAFGWHFEGDREKTC